MDFITYIHLSEQALRKLAAKAPAPQEEPPADSRKVGEFADLKPAEPARPFRIWVRGASKPATAEEALAYLNHDGMWRRIG